jgi:hypothetical protein
MTYQKKEENAKQDKAIYPQPERNAKDLSVSIMDNTKL